MGEADISKGCRCVKTLPHIEELSTCYIGKNLCTGSGCSLPCDTSKLSKCVEAKILVL